MTAVISVVPESTLADEIIDDGHLVCCEIENVGERTLSFCGQPTDFDGIITDDPVDCQQCNELERRDYCPLKLDHRCSYARDTLFVLIGYFRR